MTILNIIHHAVQSCFFLAFSPRILVISTVYICLTLEKMAFGNGVYFYFKNGNAIVGCKIIKVGVVIKNANEIYLLSKFG